MTRVLRPGRTSGPPTIRLWTIQPLVAWEELRTTGQLRATWDKMENDFHRRPYLWLIEQMKKRVGNPPLDCEIPIWAWAQWESHERVRPDLRAIRWWHPKGEKNVRIEFDCPTRDVLLSDYELWHHVLNNWYLASSESDSNCFDAQWGHPSETEILANPTLRKLIEESWVRIFDLEWEDSYCTSPCSKKSIQATLWSLELDWVLAVTPFVGSRCE